MNMVLLAGSQTDPSSPWQFYTATGQRITNVLSVNLHLLPSSTQPLVEIELGLATSPMHPFAPVQFDGIVAAPVQLAQVASVAAQVAAQLVKIWIAMPSDFLRCIKHEGDT